MMLSCRCGPKSFRLSICGDGFEASLPPAGAGFFGPSVMSTRRSRETTQVYSN